MARGIKQKTGLDTDFSITDAMKRANIRKAQLREAAGYETPNETDMINEELENADESPEIRKIFEN